MELNDLITKFVLENALKFGKANPGKIIGKIMGSDPSFRSQAKEIMGKIQAEVKRVNALDADKIKEELLSVDPDFEKNQAEQREENKKKRGELPPLRNAEVGKVVTRMPPEPSKFNHVGHALSFLINYMYAEMYNGKCILRFDDTNPEKARQEYVDAVFEDIVEYLGIKPSDVRYASDHMEKYYEYAEKLVNEGNAYVCFCAQEDMSKGRREMKECSHRDKTVEEEKELWEKMKAGEFKEGECVLRLKIDMNHKNAVMRDPVIYRLSYTSHYRVGDKYKVWPMYDFESSIEEGLNEITHVMRSNEFESRIELQHYIADLFGFNKVEFRQYGRFNIIGASTKGREIRAMIESGEYIGWDDPRLVTLRALRRRGIVKETYIELTKKAGLSKQQTNIDYSVLASINRSILDRTSRRLFIIEEPVEIVVNGFGDGKKVELDFHPEEKDNGRVFDVDGKFIIEKEDFDSVGDGEMFRLMDCVNVKKVGEKVEFDSWDYDDFKGKGKKIIHWLPVSKSVEAEILMPDMKVRKGRVELNVENISVGDVIQFERKDFCRLDSKDDGIYSFWYTHN